jgi:hypothetical protein
MVSRAPVKARGKERKAPSTKSTSPRAAATKMHNNYGEVGGLLMQKLICKHKGLIPDLNVKACQPN